MIQHLKTRLAQAFWSRRFRAGWPHTWMHEEIVRRYINRSVSGDPHRWPMEWFAERYARQPFARGVSLGSGEGALERDIAAKGICCSMVGVDLSPAAVEKAAERAKAAGWQTIEYQRGDMNQLVLPESHFEIAFFHQSLHHVERLDTCLCAVAAALVPEGLLYLDEYIGPSRGDWRQELIAEAERFYRTLPAAVRRSRRVTLPVDWRDPSEAIRSGEIVASLEKYFEIEERRDYGGNLLSVLYPHLALDSLEPSDRESLLEGLIAAEEEHLATGASSYYSVLVARPR